MKQDAYEQMLDMADDVIFVVDRDMVVTYVNRTGAVSLGHRQEDITGKPLSNIFPPAVFEHFLDYILEVFETGNPGSGPYQRLFLALNRQMDIKLTPLPERDGRVSRVMGICREISAHTLVERASHENDERYRHLIENAPVGIFTMDTNGTVTSINGKILDLMKAPGNFAKPVNILTSPPMVETGIQEDAAACLFEGKQIIKERLCSPGGKEQVYMRHHLTPLRDNDGRITGALGIVEDITERKRTEEALQNSEKFLNNVLESIRDGISILDKDLTIIRVNRVLEEWYGHMMPIKGKKCYQVYHGRSAPCEVCPSLRAISLSRAQSEVVLFEGSNGRQLGWQEVHSFPMTDDENRVIGVIEYVRDITTRKKAEIALQESEDTFRILAETSTSIMLLIQDGKIVYLNPRCKDVIGYSKEDIAKMNFWNLVHPDDRETVKARIIERMSGKKVPPRYDVRIIDRNGKLVWMDASMAIIRYKGRPAELVTAVDMTEKMEKEEEMKAAKATAELYLDLMGHDINNMHQVALGYLELARAKSPENRREDLDQPIEALQRSALLIKNVRKLQMLQERSIPTRTIELCEVLRKVREEFRSITDKNITMNLNGNLSCPVQANELIYDVFSNLVSNAIKHTGAGRAEICVSLESTQEKGDRYYRVSVEDNGPGIPDDSKSVIFNRMQQGSTKAKGLGLGLYLVKSLVDSYGGHVWIEDVVHGDHTKGARFIVMLPAKA